jgi:hypothetical protein
MAFDYNHTRAQLEQAYKRLAEHTAAALEAALQAGFEFGFRACEEALEEKERFAAMPAINGAYDEGYLDGVHDARFASELADRVIDGMMLDETLDFSNHDHAEGYTSATERPSDGSEPHQGTLDL